MKQQINEVRRMQQLAGLINENQEVNEAPANLAKKAEELYKEMLKTGDTFDIDDNIVDIRMEKIANTKKRFTSAKFPKFDKLNHNQLKAIIPFLEAVIKRKYFNSGNDWDGEQITDDEEGYDE